MKLCILVKDGVKIVGISEDEETIIGYLLQNNLSLDEYGYYKVKGDEAEKVAINFEDEFLIHDIELDMIFTHMEWKIVSDTINEEKSRIKTTLSDLEHYIKFYRMSKKERTVLLQAHSILHSNKKFEKLKKTINLSEFIDFLTNRKTISDLFKTTTKKASDLLKVIINFDDKK
jgi:hypothetical protein